MKSNQVSVLVVLLLCLVMGGFLYVVDRSSDEEAGWTPSELYGELGARSYEGSSFSDVTFSGGGNSDGVAVSMRNGSFSLRTRASRASSLTPNNPIASSPNNLPSLQGGAGGRLSSPNSLIGHMTSSAEFHSFGGGSNMAMGSYTSSSNNLIASSPAIGSYRPSPSSPIALSPNNLIAYSPSNGEVQVAAEQAIMSASSSASGLFGGMMTSYGTATYDQTVYGSYGSKPSGVRGRQDAGPWESWLKWLSEHEGLGNDGISGTEDDGYWGTWIEGEGGSYTITYSEEQLRKAYEAWVNSQPLGSLTPGLPSFEAWWEWMRSGEYEGYGYGGNTYRWVPVGNIFPLLILALMYVAYLVVRRRKSLAVQA